MRIDLGNDQWAEVFSVEEMPRRMLVRVEDLLAESPEDASGFKVARRMSEIRDTLMAMLITAWSFGDPPGDAPEDLYDLPKSAYDRLVEGTRPQWEAAGFSGPAKTEGEEEKPAKTKRATRSTSSA